MSQVRRAPVGDLLNQGWTTRVDRPELAELGRAALDVARRVFALPQERKAEFVDPTGSGDAGWRSVADPVDRPDEVWQLGGEPPDLWPAELAADRALLLRLRAGCTAVVAELLADTAPVLGRSPEEFGEAVDEQRSVVRLLRYGQRAGGIGFSPHTDFGIATVFAAESVPSLELREGTGDWRKSGSAVAVAAGEMLAARAGGRIRAGVHRVCATAEQRWAVAVFVHPDAAYPLAVADGGTEITAREFFHWAMARGGDRPTQGR